MCHLWVYSKPCPLCKLTLPYTTRQAPCGLLLKPGVFGSCFPGGAGATALYAKGSTSDVGDYSLCRCCVRALNGGGVKAPTRQVVEAEGRAFGKRGEGRVLL
ncbi:hypothetical protein PT974_07043 [Cladobotryum mycophilum]|uniref:CENP-V/GFA domain-containing protein n=1 Tax=Cladobotryum mycophilum TaxID=491253 RepID=A0ABR0SN69_9HYPO